MKSSRATIIRRQKEILAYLEKNNYVKITDMAKVFDISLATMRRDAASLEKAGKIYVRQGGIELVSKNLPNFDSEPVALENALEKEAIARQAANLINDGDTVFINASSTAFKIMKYLGDKNVTILNYNGFAVEADLGPNIELVLIGGQVRNLYSNGVLKKSSMSGDLAVDMISKIDATKCILGVSGISVNGGLTSLAVHDPAVNRAMIQHSHSQVIIVADHRKIGVRHNFYFSAASEVTHLITDSASDKEELQKLRDIGIDVSVVDTDKQTVIA